jgi:hypothetical protein
MQSIIPTGPKNVVLISASALHSSFYPRDLVDGIVDRASWFALMEDYDAQKSVISCLQTLCFCLNINKILSQRICSNVNSIFYEGRPIYNWTDENQLSVNTLLLQEDVKKRDAASKKKRNSVVSM